MDTVSIVSPNYWAMESLALRSICVGCEAWKTHENTGVKNFGFESLPGCVPSGQVIVILGLSVPICEMEITVHI